MKTETYNLFPVLVKRHEGFLTPQACKGAIDYIKSKETFQGHRYLEGEAGTSYNMLENHILQDLGKNVPGCENILDNLNTLLAMYCDEAGIVRVQVNNCWCNVQNPGSRLVNHNHGTSIAGALYLFTDEKSSKMYFLNPNPYVSFMFIEQYGPYNFQHYWFKPGIGDLLIFPGWLTHGSNYDMNETHERFSMSFNADPVPGR